MKEPVITFVSQEHKQRFTTAMQAIDRMAANGECDAEYASALYVLTAHMNTWNHAESYVSHAGIDFEVLSTYACFSGGYSVLIEWTSGLFNGNTAIVPSQLMRLDENNFQLALNALHIRRYGLQVSDVVL